MVFRFNDAKRYHHKAGTIYVGINEAGQHIGLPIDRHLLTFAGTGQGKGAAFIIPNLLLWQHNAFVLDPKGENAELTWQTREAMGQRVAVLDPFRVANVPDRLRVSVNLLEAIDPESIEAGEGCKVLADGLVVRSNPEDDEWYDGACRILSGGIGYVVAEAPLEQRTFATLRRMLLQSSADLYEDAQRMAAFDGCGGVARQAGASIMAALDSEKGQDKDFLSKARGHSAWLDEKPYAAVLGEGTFSLSSLKTEPTTLFVVVPFQYLKTAAPFMRLITRAAIDAMTVGGQAGKTCLFILDEFAALGRIDAIASAAAQMRSYGVRLWPFFQDRGQLEKLYSKNGEVTFIENADAEIYFGCRHPETLEFVSRRLGDFTPEELSIKPPKASSPSIGHLVRQATNSPVPPAPPSGNLEGWGGFFAVLGHAIGQEAYANALSNKERAHIQIQEELRAHQAKEATERAEYEHAMRKVGTPRLTAQEIAWITSKREGQALANSSIIFTPHSSVINIHPVPHWSWQFESIKKKSAKIAAQREEEHRRLLTHQAAKVEAERIEAERIAIAVQKQEEARRAALEVQEREEAQRAALAERERAKITANGPETIERLLKWGREKRKKKCEIEALEYLKNNWGRGDIAYQTELEKRLQDILATRLKEQALIESGYTGSLCPLVSPLNKRNILKHITEDARNVTGEEIAEFNEKAKRRLPERWGGSISHV